LWSIVSEARQSAVSRHLMHGLLASVKALVGRTNWTSSLRVTHLPGARSPTVLERSGQLHPASLDVIRISKQSAHWMALSVRGHRRAVRRSNFFNPTQPNPSKSENFGPTNQPDPQPNRTPHNQRQTFGHKEDNMDTLFHRNIMTASKKPVNKHDNCQ